jgi:DNA-3-methyladenine glycosylase II
MTSSQLKRQLEAIAKVDADVKSALIEVGYPEPRVRAQGFETLLSIIVGQQISTHAANAIMQRIRVLLPVMTAECLLDLPPLALREAGLSARKQEYAQGLAKAIVEQKFRPEDLSEMDDDQVIKEISSLRGFGVWSAQIYLMFSLQREDIFPQDDLALQVALQRLKKLEQKPTPAQARQLMQPWAPWRSAGSVFLWHYYRGAPT